MTTPDQTVPDELFGCWKRQWISRWLRWSVEHSTIPARVGNRGGPRPGDQPREARCRSSSGYFFSQLGNWSYRPSKTNTPRSPRRTRGTDQPPPLREQSVRAAHHRLVGTRRRQAAPHDHDLRSVPAGRWFLTDRPHRVGSQPATDRRGARVEHRTRPALLPPGCRPHYLTTQELKRPRKPVGVRTCSTPCPSWRRYGAQSRPSPAGMASAAGR